MWKFLIGPCHGMTSSFHQYSMPIQFRGLPVWDPNTTVLGRETNTRYNYCRVLDVGGGKLGLNGVGISRGHPPFFCETLILRSLFRFKLELSISLTLHCSLFTSHRHVEGNIEEYL